MRRLRDALAVALDLPLHPEVTVTAQRMHPGDGAGPHTDHPLAGYEAARLILQLDAPRGGAFRALGADGRPWLTRDPRPNGAVAMALSPRSWHDVADCLDLRRTVVLHAWHAANPPDARERLDAWFAGWSPAHLPTAWDPMVLDVEARVPDEVSLAAAATAWTLLRWGRSEAEAREAYRSVADGRQPLPEAAWAAWLFDLHRDGFDADAWGALVPLDTPCPPALRPFDRPGSPR